MIRKAVTAKGKRQGDLPSVGSLPEWLGQDKASSFMLSYVVAGATHLGHPLLSSGVSRELVEKCSN